MILITGASGHLGKATIDSLLKKGIAPNIISALVRDEAKAAGLKGKGVHLGKGDYEKQRSLLSAFTGVDTLFLISSSDVSNRQQHHENVINAAKKHKSGVSFLPLSLGKKKTSVHQ
jgi:NAD(P)H dehydrogenase (quinone)